MASTPRPSRRRRTRLLLGVAAGLLLVGSTGTALVLQDPADQDDRVALSQVLAAVRSGDVATAAVDQDRAVVSVVLADGEQVEAAYPVGYVDTLTSALVDAGVVVDTDARSAPSPLLDRVLPVLLIAVLLALFLWAMRSGAFSANRMTRG